MYIHLCSEGFSLLQVRAELYILYIQMPVCTVTTCVPGDLGIKRHMAQSFRLGMVTKPAAGGPWGGDRPGWEVSRQPWGGRGTRETRTRGRGDEDPTASGMLWGAPGH